MFGWGNRNPVPKDRMRKAVGKEAPDSPQLVELKERRAALQARIGTNSWVPEDARQLVLLEQAITELEKKG